MQMPDRVAFTVFGKDIYWYGVLMAAGIVIAVLLAMREGKRKKLPEDTVIDLCLVVIPLGVVFARLYYVLFELDHYLQDPISVLYVWEGGLAIYGAVIGGLLGAVIYARVKKLRFLRLADCVAPGLVLAQAIGRWGNFFNQEAFGLPINNGELLWFPFAVKIEGLHYFDGVVCNNPYHMATFFYESAWCLLIFIFLWSRRKKFRHDGDAFFIYALLYAFERMFVEGLRGDSLKIGEARVSQILSAVAFAAVLIFFIVRRVKEKKEGRLLWPAPLAAAEENAPGEAEPAEIAKVEEPAQTGIETEQEAEAARPEENEDEEN
ncbi:MAG: prolipoprotein diacylglyceryl transferase [Clostridiaceae bacterium]|nr:prolipoprotein diacylglyceryl transferase [Eubacteriales bacterium]